MTTPNAIASLAALVGEPARACMLLALMDGRALTATELATCARVTSQTASSHLSQMVSAGLLAMERQGRHRYHRLADAAIARMIEGLMAVAADKAPALPRAPRTGPRDLALRQARSCYDHLAGRVAVAITDSMLARGEIEFGPDGGILTPEGAARLQEAGILSAEDLHAAGRRVLCRPCLDWSERRPHLGGQVGAALFTRLLDQDWVRRTAGSRAVTFTPPGRLQLTRLFGLDAACWRSFEEP